MSDADRLEYEEHLRFTLVANARELLSGPFSLNDTQAFILRQLLEQFDWVAPETSAAPF